MMMMMPLIRSWLVRSASGYNATCEDNCAGDDANFTKEVEDGAVLPVKQRRRLFYI
jgi:hypothetical protein